MMFPDGMLNGNVMPLYRFGFFGLIQNGSSYNKAE